MVAPQGLSIRMATVRTKNCYLSAQLNDWLHCRSPWKDQGLYSGLISGFCFVRTHSSAKPISY
jgi:hypothetical protein